MINQRDDLYKRIREYEFNIDCTSPGYNAKLDLLESAIDDAIKEICQKILSSGSELLHLGYSGGVDSSLILVKMLEHFEGHPVVAHTIGAKKDFPDIVYSERFIKHLKNTNLNLIHNVHIMQVSDKDTRELNRILCGDMNYPSNYYMLMKAISPICPETGQIVSCDIIDELMGGYYAHRNPEKLPCFDPQRSIVENRLLALGHFMENLIKNHLSILDAMSSYFNVEVFLPYGSEGVMNCASMFNVTEMVDDAERKKPIYALAKRNGVAKYILERRKYGLCSAMNLERKS